MEINAETDRNVVHSCKSGQQMRRKTSSKVDPKELILNPFSQELYIEVSTRLDSEAKIRDELGNEVPATSLIEKALTTKIYKTAATREQAMNLSATALKMFVLIQYELQTNCDWIEMTPEWYISVVGKGGSRNSHKRGTDELMRYGYITPTKFKHVYWINPRLIYAGNRIEKYKNNVVIKNVYTGKPKEKAKVTAVESAGMKLGKKKGYQEPKVNEQTMEVI